MPNAWTLLLLLVPVTANVFQDMTCEPVPKVEEASESRAPAPSLLQISQNRNTLPATPQLTASTPIHVSNDHGANASARRQNPMPAALVDSSMEARDETLEVQPLDSIETAKAKAITSTAYSRANQRAKQSWNLKPPAGNLTSEPGNLCLRASGGAEHLVPEFVLLGTEKAASSSFWNAFTQNEGVVYPMHNGQMEKEMLIFSTHNFDLGLDAWLDHFPQCSHTARQVVYDCTPTYLRDQRVPQRMKQFYGGLSARIKFAVILREPIGRMHSAWHFYRQYHVSDHLCPQTRNASFQTYVQGVLAGQDPCKFLSTGDYAVQLRWFFSEFNASQFTVFLVRDVESSTSLSAIGDIWQSLGLHGSPPAMEDVNHVSHQNLSEDLDEATTLALQRHVGSVMSAEKVAEALIESANKPVLVGYQGNFDKASVTSWIDQNW